MYPGTHVVLVTHLKLYTIIQSLICTNDLKVLQQQQNYNNESVHHHHVCLKINTHEH
jgi:hypothetical protein